MAQKPRSSNELPSCNSVIANHSKLFVFVSIARRFEREACVAYSDLLLEAKLRKHDAIVTAIIAEDPEMYGENGEEREVLVRSDNEMVTPKACTLEWHGGRLYISRIKTAQITAQTTTTLITAQMNTLITALTTHKITTLITALTTALITALLAALITTLITTEREL